MTSRHSNNEEDLFFVDYSTLWDVLTQFVDKKVFVIGGSSIYYLLFPFCKVVHYTLVDLEPEGDVEFPFSMGYLWNKSNGNYEEHDLWTTSISSINYKYITFNINIHKKYKATQTQLGIIKLI